MGLKSLGLGEVFQAVHLQPVAGDVTNFDLNSILQQMRKEGVEAKFFETSMGAQLL